MKKIYLLLAVTLASASLSLGLVSTAEAAWGELFCDILNSKTSALTAAVNGYNRDEEGDRICKKAIRFKAKQTILIPNGFKITQTPPSGFTYGVSIRKCVPSGTYAESGCPSLTNTDVVLDASGYTRDGGGLSDQGLPECPDRYSKD